MTDTRINLKKTFEGKENEINVIVHSFPDPDAISSAIAAQQVIKLTNHKPGKIYYSGEISHPQNRSMLTLLDIEMINYEEEPFDPGSPAVLVDTNTVGPQSNQGNISPSDVKVLAVFDHHKGKHPRGVDVDCRPVGSTAAIMWDYLHSLHYDFDADDGKKMATALIVGISTDTATLTSDTVSDLDFEAYRFLIQKLNRQILVSIMEYPVPPYLFDLRQRAFMEENKRVEDSTVVSGVGVISQSKRDAIPIIADEFLRMAGVTLSVVFAVVDDQIDISVRSKNVTVDVGMFLQKVFGAGGGKQGAGRAQIPLGFFHITNTEIQGQVWEVVKKLVFLKVLNNVKGE